MSRGRLAAPGLAMLAGFAGMLLVPPHPGRTAPFLGLFLLVFGCYAFAAAAVLRSTGVPPGSGPAGGPPDDAPPGTHAAAGRTRRSVSAESVVLGLACLFRAIFLFAAPALSDDIYRYEWDGRVVLRGGNPYLTPPASAGPPTAPGPPGAASHAPSAATRRIGHPEVPTIYPPAAQALFAAGAAIGGGILGIKVLLLLAELLAIATLRRLLVLRGLPPLRILIYAWNSLAVVEIAWSGHLEPAGILWVLVAAAAIIQKRDGWAALSLAVAGLVKLLPLALFAPFVRSLRARCLLAAAALLALGYWPFRAAGRHLFDGLRAYAGRWVANESIFGVVHAAVAALDPTGALKSCVAWLRRHLPGSEPLDLLYPYLYPPDIARALCALATVGFAAFLVRRRVEPLRGACLLTGALLLLSPTVHPWYLLWILPWMCLFPSGPWILLSGLVVLWYANLGSPGHAAEPHGWVRLVEYVPFYAWMAAGWVRNRRAASSPPAPDDRLAHGRSS